MFTSFVFGCDIGDVNPRACTPYSPFPGPHTFASKPALPDES